MTDIPEIKKRPIILIHGAWHGAWVWEQWISLFKNRGFDRLIPVELRGHGYKVGSYERARLEDYVQDIKTIIGTLNEEPILIGHSLGCSIMRELLAEKPYPAAVLIAPIPESKLFRRVFIKQLYRHPMMSLRSVLSGSMLPWVSGSHSSELFFSEYMPINEARAYTDRMQGESFRLFMLDLMRAAPVQQSGTPTLVVAAQNDKFFPVKVQRTTAQMLGSDFVVAPNAGHDIMLDTTSAQTAEEVIAWLERTLS